MNEKKCTSTVHALSGRSASTAIISFSILSTRDFALAGRGCAILQRRYFTMRSDFRVGLVGGIAATVEIGFYCLWLWQEELQVVRHTENLFRRIEQRNWSGVADLLAPDYADLICVSNPDSKFRRGSNRSAATFRERAAILFSMTQLRARFGCKAESRAVCRPDNSGQ